MENPPFFKQQWFLSIISIILLLIPLLWAVSVFPIQLWDESRLALNAVEMSRNHHWLVPTFGGHPDMWNTKPPLLIWLQTLTIEIIGICPIAVRIPIVIAVIITCFYLFTTVRKISKDYMPAFLAVLILITTGGYMTGHVAFTGDYDGLLILFTTLFCFNFFQFLNTGKVKYLYLFFLFLWLGIMTKSIEGLMLLPGLLLYALWQKKLGIIFKNKHLYVGVISLIVLTALYYLLRESCNPGYLKAVYKNELGGRFLGTLEGHGSPFYYYFEFKHFYYWLIFYILGIIISFRIKRPGLKNLIQFCVLLSLSYLLIISCSQTKLSWYVAPVFPFTAVVTAMPVLKLYEYLRRKFIPKGRKGIWLSTFIIGLLFVFPYARTLAHIHSEWKTAQQSIPDYIRDMVAGENNIMPVTAVFKEGYLPQINFYILMARAKGFSVKLAGVPQLEPGDTVLISGATDREKVVNHFKTEVEYAKGNLVVLRILQVKT